MIEKYTQVVEGYQLPEDDAVEAFRVLSGLIGPGVGVYLRESGGYEIGIGGPTGRIIKGGEWVVKYPGRGSVRVFSDKEFRAAGFEATS